MKQIKKISITKRLTMYQTKSIKYIKQNLYYFRLFKVLNNFQTFVSSNFYYNNRIYVLRKETGIKGVLALGRNKATPTGSLESQGRGKGLGGFLNPW